MRAALSVAALALAALGFCGQASAQSQTGGVTFGMPSWEQDRFRISIDAGAQLSSTAFDTSTTRLVYLENAAIDTSYRISRGPAVDAGISLRVAGDLGVGVVVSGFRSNDDADVSASIPHPFFFRTPRTITGAATELRREEIVTHVQGSYSIRPARQVEVVLTAGPSFFRVRQQVVTDVAFVETYPYDTAAFGSASVQRIRGSATGFNVGADVGKRFARHAGIGGGVRFSRAKINLDVPNSTNTVSIDVGGVQVAGGLRLYF